MHIYLLLYSLLLVFPCPALLCNTQWVYNYTLFVKQASHKKLLHEYIVKKEPVHCFSQLLFSWNAHRPSKGYFSFFVCVRNAHTKAWGKWHHAFDWGDGIQKSYASTKDLFSEYVHVRLEVIKPNMADACMIKIKPHHGASVENINSITIACINRNLFVSELGSEQKKLSSVVIPHVPVLSQFSVNHNDNGRMCSPTSCSMLMQFLMHNNAIDPLMFAQKAYDHGLQAYGSWQFNIAHIFEMSGGLCGGYVTRLNSFADIHHNLMQGVPIVVSVRGILPGAPKPYDQGHLLLVVGFDDTTKEVICHDPAFMADQSILMRYTLTDFIRAWELSYRLAYVVEIKK